MPSIELDDDVLEDAANTVYSHLGSLLDLPEELRNTIASLYYEVSWFQTNNFPLTDHLPTHQPESKILDRQ